jgi:hypothetical protein
VKGLETAVESSLEQHAGIGRVEPTLNTPSKCEPSGIHKNPNNPHYILPFLFLSIRTTTALQELIVMWQSTDCHVEEKQEKTH